jgi:hypothetical protein
MSLLTLSQNHAYKVRIIDKANERNEPLRWHNLITIIHGNKSLTVRRYTAYNHGLCSGAHGLPPQPQKSELRQNPGRKSKDKLPVTIQVSKDIIEGFGGIRQMQRSLLTYVKSKL